MAPHEKRQRAAFVVDRPRYLWVGAVALAAVVGITYFMAARPPAGGSSLPTATKAAEDLSQSLNPAAAHHLPPFITAPGDTDILMGIMAVVLIGSVLGVGVFFFWLHSLPERMVHNKIQFDIVAVLGLLSLFTHMHAFWVAALILAVIKFPEFSVLDFLGPLRSTAGSLEKMADTGTDPLRRIAGSLEKMADTDSKPDGKTREKRG